MEDDEDGILVQIQADDFAKVPLAAIKDAQVYLLYDLPVDENTKSVRVDITALENIDSRFQHLWDTVLKYQEMFHIEGVKLICDNPEKKNHLSASESVTFLHPYLT